LLNSGPVLTCPSFPGFEKRTHGSHHLFRKEGVEEKINLQRAGNNAKP
jgi:hypothetical protein